MNVYDVLTIVTFIMVSIIAISQYINANVPKVADVMQLMNILPCYEIKAFKDGKRLTRSELVQLINSPVKAHKLKNGILYIEIY